MESINDIINNKDLDIRLRFLIREEYRYYKVEDVLDLIENAKIDHSYIQFDDIDWTIATETETIAYVNQYIDDCIDQLRHETRHCYDRLIDCIDYQQVDISIYEVYDGVGEGEIDGEYFYYWKL